MVSHLSVEVERILFTHKGISGPAASNACFEPESRYQKVFFTSSRICLAVWNMIFLTFHNMWDNPSHWLSYFSRLLKPPTRWVLECSPWFCPAMFFFLFLCCFMRMAGASGFILLGTPCRCPQATGLGFAALPERGDMGRWLNPDGVPFSMLLMTLKSVSTATEVFCSEFSACSMSFPGGSVGVAPAACRELSETSESPSHVGALFFGRDSSGLSWASEIFGSLGWRACPPCSALLDDNLRARCGHLRTFLQFCADIEFANVCHRWSN